MTNVRGWWGFGGFSDIITQTVKGDQSKNRIKIRSTNGFKVMEIYGKFFVDVDLGLF